MDRQHPRDFFDGRGLVERGGLTVEVVECFACHLAGHNRPVHEVLFSRNQDMSSAFENEFLGMIRHPITLVELQRAHRKLKVELPAALTSNHRELLLALVEGEPSLASSVIVSTPTWALQSANRRSANLRSVVLRDRRNCLPPLFRSA